MTDNKKAVSSSSGVTPHKTDNTAHDDENIKCFASLETEDELVERVLEKHLSQVNPDVPPNPRQFAGALLTDIRGQYSAHNACVVREERYRLPQRLTRFCVAQILMRVYRIVHIIYADDDDFACTNVFGFYCIKGSHRGIYITATTEIQNLARQYDSQISINDLKEIFQIFSESAPKVYRCNDPDLVAVNNGIFNYRTKQLLDFTPDLVFTSKSKVDYNPQAVNVVIHNDDDNTDWNVVDWLNSLSDDPEVVELLWQILGALVRCHVRWNKGVFFVSSVGNNGKGTLCELMRGLCGKGSFMSLPLSEFGKEFSLSPLVGVNAIITDENEFEYLDKVARLKAIITGDPIYANRKFLTPITLRFDGFMIQCLNDEAPRFKDKTSSLYRRILAVPFDKCFTGIERKYIKSDYVHRKEVLEYVLFRVLNMDYDELSEPSACLALLDTIKVSNDSVRQFLDDVLPQLQWDLVPYSFLYDFYRSWKDRNCPAGTVESKVTFISRVKSLLAGNKDWQAERNPVTTGALMDLPEPLIAKYNLANWYNPLYHGPDETKIGTPSLKLSYRGIKRR